MKTNPPQRTLQGIFTHKTLGNKHIIATRWDKINMSKDAEYTKKYLQKRKTKRYAFDLYADDADELKLIELLDKAKADKQLKTVIKQSLLAHIKQS